MIFHIFNVLLTVIAFILFIPTLFFTLECLVGLFVKIKKSDITEIVDYRSVILVPAHNEAAVIKDTLLSIQPQLREQDEIIVIADNCTDETANIVREMGHTVIERENDQKRGKGYALAYGLELASNSPPEVIVIVDADCIIEDNCLAILTQTAIVNQQPVQGCYLMHAENTASFALKISQFAILVKNKIRMQGLSKIAINVPLLGSGMAFPWEIIKDMPLASGEIVEDMYLGLNLLINNSPCLYSADAYINSPLPTEKKVQTGQRERWEHGHIDLIRRLSPVLFHEGIKQKRGSLFVALIDLCIPPLALLVLLHFCFLFIIAMLVVIGCSSFSLKIMLISLILLSMVVFLTWWISGRKILTLQDFFKIPSYVFSKISIYTHFFENKQTAWVKTKRK